MTAEHRVRQALRAAEPALRSTPSAVRVLVVCDEPILREALLGHLGAAPATTAVGWADNVPAAGLLADRQRVDVVLAAVHPVDRLQDLARATDRPVLALTYVGSAAEATRMLADGLTGVLTRRAAAVEIVDALLAVRHRIHVLPNLGGPSSQPTANSAPGALAAEPARPTSAETGDVPLTNREREIVQLVVDGYSVKQIASRLGIAMQTAKNHVHHVMGKVGASTRLQLYTWATAHGFEQRQGNGGNGQPTGQLRLPGTDTGTA